MTKLNAINATLLATAVCGTLDMLFALTSAGFRGTPPNRVLQYISSGLIGRSAFQHGAITAALGLALHYTMMLAICAFFIAASRKQPILTQVWPATGVLYGIGVYILMSHVVIPASAIGTQPFHWATSLPQIAAMVLLVGLPTAWIAQRTGTGF